jgi:hypothetical protein
MEKIIQGVLISALTFGISFVAHAFRRPPAAAIEPRMPVQESSSPPPPSFIFHQAVSKPSPSPDRRRVTQETGVTMPVIGKVRVAAYQGLGDGPEVTFTSMTSGKELLAEFFSDDGAWSLEHGQVRFRVVRIKGLPNPIIISIGMNPGGSDSGWECVAAGVVNGELEQLTYEHLFTSNEGGFFFGDLGRGIGLGAAQWDFVWGEDEAHVSPHQYEVKLFKWDGWRFQWHKVVRTRRTYRTGETALRELGFNFKDIRKQFPEWADLDEW